jgi:SAM-dependent methyltransferase
MASLISRRVLSRIGRLFRSVKKTKTMTSGEAEHWRTVLRDLYRSQYGLEMHKLQSDEAIVPPKAVVDIVQGRSKADPNTFFGTGYREMVRFLTELHAHSFNVSRMERMLDFGFGTGRILVHFLPFAIQRYGCDVTPKAYAWTSKTLGTHAQLSLTQLHPPLPFSEDFFDLIIATSVFTHTPYARQPGWIAELHRILKPDGCVLATVLDFVEMPPAYLARGWHEKGDKRGIHMRTFLTPTKLTELWSSAFEVLEIRTYTPDQAHVIVKKRPRGG